MSVCPNLPSHYHRWALSCPLSTRVGLVLVPRNIRPTKIHSVYNYGVNAGLGVFLIKCICHSHPNQSSVFDNPQSFVSLGSSNSEFGPSFLNMRIGVLVLGLLAVTPLPPFHLTRGLRRITTHCKRQCNLPRKCLQPCLLQVSNDN